MRNRPIWLVVIGILFMFLLYLGYNIAETVIRSSESGSNYDSSAEFEQDNEMKPEVTDIEINFKETNNENLKELFPDVMTSREMEETIHFMTHGLVHAEQKWGEVEITEDRIERLLYVAERNADTYKHGNQYVEMLKRWNDGDFSKAVRDHNFIWDLWGGTVGKATRLLTPGEIEKYNETHFK
ncbi:DUF6241 domain-containing protein [Shouchella patagoniensis]|uniref:DUF6241 domain-containing protein n=1 Tax=Shouchella patagoniensis TaxID=228576 RepID=UPI0009949ED2|nr:DUF6241 domain-containing protein [Shouchella patagoniensis]